MPTFIQVALSLIVAFVAAAGAFLVGGFMVVFNLFVGAAALFLGIFATVFAVAMRVFRPGKK